MTAGIRLVLTFPSLNYSLFRSFGYSITVSASFINEKLSCPSNAKGLFGEFQGPLGLPKMFEAYYNKARMQVIIFQSN